MDKKVFYQDFLFKDITVTKDGYPDIEYAYCNDVASCKSLRLNREQKDKKLSILLTYLMGITKEEKWHKLEDRVSRLDELIIIDDIDLQNQELEEYKSFFIKTYLWKLGKLCECMVKKNLENDQAAAI